MPGSRRRRQPALITFWPTRATCRARMARKRPGICWRLPGWPPWPGARSSARTRRESAAILLRQEGRRPGRRLRATAQTLIPFAVARCLIYRALRNPYCTIAQIARFTPTITTAAPGMSRSAFFSRSGSPPAIAPIKRELTARPAHPQVITNQWPSRSCAERHCQP